MPTMETATIRGRTICLEEFAFVWQNSNNIQQVRDRMGLNYDDISNSDISSIASRIRQNVPSLKTMSKGHATDYSGVEDMLDWMDRQPDDVTFEDYRRYIQNGQQ